MILLKIAGYWFVISGALFAAWLVFLWIWRKRDDWTYRRHRRRHPGYLHDPASVTSVDFVRREKLP